MLNCQDCGSEIRNGAKFCPNCGAKIIIENNSQEDTEFKFCVNCGCKMDNNVKFCPDCGSSTDDTVHEKTSTVVQNNKKKLNN